MRVVTILAGIGVVGPALVAAVGVDQVAEALLVFVAVGVVPGTNWVLSPGAMLGAAGGLLAVCLGFAARKQLARLPRLVWSAQQLAVAGSGDSVSQRLASNGLHLARKRAR